MTIKQTRAIDNLMKTNGNVSKAMRLAGYSKATVNQPKVLTDSNAWRKVMAQYLPDHKLFKTHEDALTATKWNDFTGDREADHNIRLKAVDMAYKLKGRDTNGNTQNTQINISFDGTGYIPPDNTLGIKPTKK